MVTHVEILLDTAHLGFYFVNSSRRAWSHVFDRVFHFCRNSLFLEEAEEKSWKRSNKSKMAAIISLVHLPVDEKIF